MHDTIAVLAAAGALGEGANWEGLRGCLELDLKLITIAVDLAESQPCKCHLHPHAAHFAYGTRLDSTADGSTIPKLELFVGDSDKEVALPREGYLHKSPP
jgi:hypothetical protein